MKDQIKTLKEKYALPNYRRDLGGAAVFGEVFYAYHTLWALDCSADALVGYDYSTGERVKSIALPEEKEKPKNRVCRYDEASGSIYCVSCTQQKFFQYDKNGKLLRCLPVPHPYGFYVSTREKEYFLSGLDTQQQWYEIINDTLVKSHCTCSAPQSFPDSIVGFFTAAQGIGAYYKMSRSVLLFNKGHFVNAAVLQEVDSPVYKIIYLPRCKTYVVLTSNKQQTTLYLYDTSWTYIRHILFADYPRIGSMEVIDEAVVVLSSFYNHSLKVFDFDFNRCVHAFGK